MGQGHGMLKDGDGNRMGLGHSGIGAQWARDMIGWGHNGMEKDGDTVGLGHNGMGHSDNGIEKDRDTMELGHNGTGHNGMEKD